MLDQVTFLLDCAHVIVLEPNISSGPLPASLLSGAAGPKDHDVRAQRIEHVAIAEFKTFSDRDHEHNRSYAPGNAKHGQETAQLMGPNIAQCLQENFAQQ